MECLKFILVQVSDTHCIDIEDENHRGVLREENHLYMFQDIEENESETSPRSSSRFVGADESISSHNDADAIMITSSCSSSKNR